MTTEAVLSAPLQPVSLGRCHRKHTDEGQMNLNCTNQQGKRVIKERAIFQAIHEVVDGNDGG